MRPIPGVLRCILALVVVACGSDGKQKPLSNAIDSAGVTIVTSRGPQWADGDGWRLAATPMFDLGAYDAEGPELFDEVAGAMRLSSGVVVVAERGALELRFFEEDGEHIRTVGRKGGGPGEFENVRFLELWRGDSLIVYDGNRQMYSVFDSAGQFARSFRLEPTDSVRGPNPIGLLADGRVVTRAYAPIERPRAGNVASRWFPVQTFDLAGSFIGHGTKSEAELFVWTWPNGRIAGLMMRFGNQTHLGTGPTDLILMRSRQRELTWYPDGASTIGRIARWPAEARPVTDADWEGYIEESTSDPQYPQVLRDKYQEMPRAETMPYAEGVVVDDGGNVWLRDFQSPLDTATTLTVISADGKLLGQVAVPFRFRPYHIGADFILGTWEGEDGVPHVQLHHLIK